MNKKIKVQIYGAWDWVVAGGNSSGGCGGCGSKNKSGSAGDASKGCGGCSSSKGGGCGGCGGHHGESGGHESSEPKQHIQTTEVKNNTEFEFVDIRRVNILDHDDIRTLYDMDYELPYCCIDGIVRYYGGVHNTLIYNDIKELLED